MEDLLGKYPPNGDDKEVERKAWWASRDKYKNDECAKYGVDPKSEYRLTDCFIAMLKKDYGFTEVEFADVFTEYNG